MVTSLRKEFHFDWVRKSIGFSLKEGSKAKKMINGKRKEANELLEKLNYQTGIRMNSEDERFGEDLDLIQNQI